MHNKTICKILMIGPSLDGLGGISRVVQIWRENGLFQTNDYQVRYLASSTEGLINKIMYPVLAWFTLCANFFHKNILVYIHSSAHTSFFRKTLFIFPAIIARKKIVIHIHPAHFVDFIKELRGSRKVWAMFILNRVSGFIVLTDNLSIEVSKIFPGKQIWVLRNPVEINQLVNPGGIKRERNRLIFLGWFIVEKGVYELVDAIGILVERGYSVRLDFYGTKDAKRLKDYVTSKGLNKMINVNGWIGLEEKVKALYQSTMLILPSHTEGVPNVILEAMATHTPIVSTQVGGLKDVLRDGENALIVRVQDPEDLCKKITLLLDSPELCSQLAENAYNEACKKYDIPQTLLNFSEMIKQITL